MGEWVDAKWGDLATLEYGKALRGYQNADGPYRVFGTNGPIGRHTEPLCNHPTVIVGRKGAYRGIHYSDAPCFLIDTAFYLDPKTDFDMKWAYYELLTHDINAMDSGSAIPSTSRDSFYQLPVRVPPPHEQKAIAHILGTLDDKIELNRRMNETLEGIARAIFKSWFVDFDPVHAKAEGRDTGLPKEIEDLFPDSFEDSELGQIPMGWKVGKIGDVLELAYGKSLSKKVRVEGPYPVYGSGGISGTHNEALVAGPGIIVGRKGTVGSIYWEESDFFPIDTVFYVRPHIESSLRWIYEMLQLVDIAHLAADSAVPGVNRNAVHDHACLLPQHDLIALFGTTVQPYIERYNSNSLQMNSIATIRDALLSQLMQGNLSAHHTQEVNG